MENQTELNGFVFLRSYYEAIKELDGDDRLELNDAIQALVFDNIQPNFSKKYLFGYFKLIQPTLEASLTRYRNSVENGKKGGKKATPKTTPKTTAEVIKVQEVEVKKVIAKKPFKDVVESPTKETAAFFISQLGTDTEDVDTDNVDTVTVAIETKASVKQLMEYAKTKDMCFADKKMLLEKINNNSIESLKDINDFENLVKILN